MCARICAMSDETQVTEAAISAAIRARRGAMRMTNADLAKSTGISERTLYNYLRGDSKLYIGPLIELAKALDTTVDALIRDAGELMRQGLVPADATDPPGRG